jgi:dihydropteroate synthase
VSVESDEQRRRVVPAVEALVDALPGVVVSVDTTRADVARAALRAGAVIVNDVSAGTDDPAMLPMLAGCDAGCVLMHRVTSPHADRYSDRYSEPPMAGDAVTAVRGWLAERVEAAGRAGIDPGRVVIDPGLGFGKTVEQNLALIRRTGELLSIGRPVLSGLSRKSFVGRASLARESQPLERSAGTLALTVMHRLAGASIFRVHDAGPHVQALRAVDACREAD